jgi:hypothetical protein
MKHLFLAAALLAATIGTAVADEPDADPAHFFDGFGLASTCRFQQETARGAACLPYILGVFDTHMAEVKAFGAPELMCPPANVVQAQVRGAVQRYLEQVGENRATLAKPAAGIVMQALRKEFPCR